MSDIHKILNIDGNSYCLDCGKEDIDSASVNNAIFLCGNCKNGHSQLGDISIIKQLTDDFTSEELKLMEIGGNIRFLKNLSEFGISTDFSDQAFTKYLYKASEYYRNLILSELTNSEAPEKISDKEAQVLIDIHKEKKGGKNAISKVGDFFNKAANLTKSTFKSTQEKIKELEVKEKIKSTGKFISIGASKIVVSCEN